MGPPWSFSMPGPLGFQRFATSSKSLLIPLAFVVMTLIVMNSFGINMDVIYNSKRIPLQFKQSKPHIIEVGIIK